MPERNVVCCRLVFATLGALLLALHGRPLVAQDELTAARAALDDKDSAKRLAAVRALGEMGHSPNAAYALIRALCHDDPETVAEAAQALGKIAAKRDKELAGTHSRIVGALRLSFERYGKGCQRPDAESGWRGAADALWCCGPDGQAALKTLADQRIDLQLADLARRAIAGHDDSAAPGSVPAAAPGNPAAPRTGRSIHVDPAQGSDGNDGVAQPVKTIARAIRLAEPGDTIHLAPSVYYESADFSNKHGDPGNPITLDGHGAVLDGSEPVTADTWESLGDGLFRKQHLLKHIDEAVIGRWFMLWNGRMNHMGRTMKGPKAPLKKPADLQPDEWTYVAAEDAFYIRLAPGQSLEAASIRYPARSAGIIESMAASHLTVRNLTNTHVYNDGCNIHGITRDCRFENIASIECGDDGFSAHDDCHCEIDGFLSVGNSTGIADANASVTHYRRVLIRDCLGIDVLMIGDGEHSLTDAVVLSSAATPLNMDPVSGAGRSPCRLRLENVLFRRVGPAAEMRVNRGSSLSAERCTLLGAKLHAVGGTIGLGRSILAGQPRPEILLDANATWQGSGNLYDLAALRVGGREYQGNELSAQLKQLGGEADSRWLPLDVDEAGHVAGQPADVGVDQATLDRSVPQRPAEQAR